MRKIVLIVAAIIIAADLIWRDKVNTDIAVRMAQAIQEAEGWYPGSRSYRNNNPGNIKDVNQTGQTGSDEDGFAVFDTYDNGLAALVKKLKRAMGGLSKFYFPTDTISEFFEKYSGDQNEANTVAGILGVSVDTQLKDLT